jgi:cytoskeletal protein RodZ
MRIFGRRANQESAKEGVPPELKPYFDGNTTLRRLRLLAPLLVAIVLAAIIIGGSIWIRNHRAANNATQPSTNSQQATGPNQPSTNQPSQGSSANQPKTNSKPANTSPKTSPTPATTPEPSTSSELLNTGPGDGPLYAALAVAILGVLAYHVKQNRALRRG